MLVVPVVILVIPVVVLVIPVVVLVIQVVVLVVPIIVLVVQVVVLVVPVVVPVVLPALAAFGFHFGHFAGAGVDLKLVLDPVCHKGDFIIAVLQVVVALNELQVVPRQLGRQQLLGRTGADVALRGIGVVHVVAVQRHGLRADLPRFDGAAGRIGQTVQKTGRGAGTAFQPQDDVFLLPADGLVKIAARVDLADQLAHHLGAGAAFIAAVSVQHRAAVVVQAV